MIKIPNRGHIRGVIQGLWVGGGGGVTPIFTYKTHSLSMLLLVRELPITYRQPCYQYNRQTDRQIIQ